MKLILCTDQGSTFREYQELAKQLLPFVTICSPSECSLPACKLPSLGADFSSHATKLAESYNQPLLIEESTLVVPSLGQRFTCRLAVEEHNQQRHVLLNALKENPLLDRSAYMECVLTYAAPGEKTMQFKGLCEGVLLEEEQGNGFGYDPLFRKHSYNQTLAELSPHVKRTISDRGKAFARFALWLESSLSVRR